MYLKILTSLLLVGSLTACNTVKSLYSKDKKDQSSVSTPTEKISASDTPLQQLFKLQPELAEALNSVSIQQVFNNAESPTAAQLTVVNSGLLDDSVSAIRTVYQFKQQSESWTLTKTETSFKCHRGPNTKSFQDKVCP